jgi:hypothetical protein
MGTSAGLTVEEDILPDPPQETRKSAARKRRKNAASLDM